MTSPEPLHPFKSIRYAAPEPGPRLIATGAVHGNEVCGTQAILRLAEVLDRGELRLVRGSLTLVPVTNALAYRQGTRAGERNLNRALGPTATPQAFEDHVANWLCPLLAEHEVLLDLHSFQAPGRPFALVGPRDNQGDIEPFALAEREEALARRLGVDRLVDGWLATYARGVARRRAASPGASAIEHDPRYGVGTTEYMRSRGGWALTLECGQHEDPESPRVGYRALRRTLAHLGMVDEPAPQALTAIEALSLAEVVDKQHDDDRFSRPWQSFDRLQAGDLIATRHGGEELRASQDGWIMFPNAKAGPGQEWFYLAVASSRF